MNNDTTTSMERKEEVVRNENNNNEIMSSLVLSSSLVCDNKTTIPRNDDEMRDVHFLFLIHGWLGTDCSLSHVESTMKQQIECQLNQNQNVVVIHKVKCNLGQTHDGIVAGAQRLNQEIHTCVQHYFHRNNSGTSKKKASVSLWGHSLGGLYARCALATFPWHIPISTEEGEVVELLPNVFVTSVTPHLGCSSHTYIPLPTYLERIIGTVMQQTGHDLFFQESILYTMSTSSHYLVPLSKFQKRIAYANAFQTDFQVPTASAAFLYSSSTYLHQVVIPSETNMNTIVAMVQTPPNPSIYQNGYNDHDTNDKITTMSVMLDSLGWEKVFVDLRPFIPTFSSSILWKNPSTNTTTTTTNNNDTTTTTTMCTREIWNDFFQQRSSVSKNQNKT